MRHLRRLAFWLIVTLLGTGLSLLVSGWIFNATLSDKNVVKAWIVTSGIYDEFIDEVVTGSLQEVGTKDQTIDSLLLQKAASQAFPPKLLQESTESVLDGAYDWLDGSKNSVQFTLDFTEAKATYADALATLAEDRINNLPECTTSQLQAINAYDLFSSTCAPPEPVYQTAIAQIQQEITASTSFLPDPIIKGADIGLPIGGETKTIEDAFPFAPLVYQLLKNSVTIAVALIILSISILLLLTRDKLAVLKRVARSLLVAAFTTGISTGFLYYLANITLATGTAQETTLAERIMNPLLEVVARDVLFVSGVFTVIYLLFAISCFVAYKILTKRRLARHLVT
jgi:hypothetical protein